MPEPLSFGSGAALAGRTIMQIIPELAAGGAERTTIDIAGALAAHGARALVASGGGRLVSELQANGGVWTPFPARTKNPALMAANVLRLAALLRSERVDLLHARSRAPAWVALGAARLLRVPFVTTYHGAYGGASTFKTLYNSVMARSDAVIANSQFTADRIASLHPFARARTHVIPRGVDLRRLRPEAVDPARVRRLREAWGVAPGERIALLPGRITGWKGHAIMIEAAHLLQERGLSDVLVVFAGDDQGRRSTVGALERRIAAAGLAGRVRLVGHCDDMPAAYVAASVVAAPSTEPEAFGRVAVEAQAMGTPVVASDLGGARETVLATPDVEAQERTGWRVRAGDAGALADALVEALGLSASARDALSERARAHVAARFSIERMCDATLALYAGLLERGREASP